MSRPDGLPPLGDLGFNSSQLPVVLRLTGRTWETLLTAWLVDQKKPEAVVMLALEEWVDRARERKDFKAALAVAKQARRIREMGDEGEAKERRAGA